MIEIVEVTLKGEKRPLRLVVFFRAVQSQLSDLFGNQPEQEEQEGRHKAEYRHIRQSVISVKGVCVVAGSQCKKE